LKVLKHILVFTSKNIKNMNKNLIDFVSFYVGGTEGLFAKMSLEITNVLFSYKNQGLIKLI
jgi:hypothetical protein